MSNVAQTVLFKVTVTTAQDEDGRWTCIGRQTGIISRGATEKQAVDKNAEAHRAIVRRLKRNGLAALVRFMDERVIWFDFDSTGLFDEVEEEEPATSAHRELRLSVAQKDAA